MKTKNPPFYQKKKKRTYGSDLFTDQFCPRDLSLVRCGGDESIGEVLDGQLANAGADT